MDREVKTFFSNDANFPALLKEIPGAPERIFFLGNEEVFKEGLKIAVVGTRKASAAGRVLAKNFTKELTQSGIVVVSGLAMGIDSAAHEGAVELKGRTVAVLANGLDAIYPAQNENLAKKILEFGGAIISEYALGTPSFPNQFLERNRIISGLCQAVIVIEAPERSGSLATARFAGEQGREVFVIPGPVGDINYAGSHKLIRDGARLATDIKDIFEDLGIEKEIKNKPSEFNGEDKANNSILEVLSELGSPANIDKIAELANLEPQTANQKIALLVIEGIIKETEKGYTL